MSQNGTAGMQPARYMEWYEMKNIYVVMITFCLFISLTSCQPKKVDKEISFDSLYPGVEFNQKVVLTENPSAKNVGYIGSEVDLVLVNQSNETISFQISKDVSIYTFSDKKQEWIEVNNRFEYSPNEVIMFPLGSGKIDNALVFVWPEIYDFTTPIELRIVTIGHLKNNENNMVKAGAYYDIELIPFNQ